jgi:succinoglycan biosynthesis transport protein ExoP
MGGDAQGAFQSGTAKARTRMLRRLDEFATSSQDLFAAGRDASSNGIDLAKVVAFIKVSRRTVICWTLIGLALALLYSSTAVPEYTALANLILDPRKVQVFKDAPVVGDNAIDGAQVESQVEIIRSEAIARSVVRDLKLADDPEFVARRPSFAVRLLQAALGNDEAGQTKSEQDRERAAIRVLRDNIGIRRAGVTYVLEVSYRARDPEQAAKIANAIADAYILDQLDTKFQATKRASSWLQDRIEELRAQSDAAARAVQEFKTKNNLVDIGNRGLVSDQQLQELNSQLIIATSHTAEMQARLQRIVDVLKAPAPDEALGTVSDTLTSPVILRLRQQYLDVRKREADIALKYGRMHLAAVNFRNEMLELQRSIFNELRRIADSYRSDYEIAKAREESIKASLQGLVNQADKTGQAQVTLRALESSASTYRTILENFLQKYTEAVQQQSFPISDARLITSAEPPSTKSFPKTSLLILLGILAGASCGIGHCLIVRSLDRTIRSPRGLEESFGIDCLSLIPTMPAMTSQADQAKPVEENISLADASVDPSNAKSNPRYIETSHRAMRWSVAEPLSRFAESVRSIKTSIDLAAITRSVKFIGVLSSLPNEGKSTVSANLANLFANGGAKTLLMDCDLRKPTLSQSLAPNAPCGLLQMMQATVALDEALWSDPDTGLMFLPAGVTGRLANSADLLGSERMKVVLNDVSGRFDYIIIDLPPVGATVDARAISPQIDGFIMVIEWGKTRQDVLNEALTSMAMERDKFLGAALNKVNYRELNNIDGYAPGYYYNKSYGRYGYSDS